MYISFTLQPEQQKRRTALIHLLYIIMTADAYADDVEKCLNAGMNAHIAKPIDPETVYAVLAKNLMPQ